MTDDEAGLAAALDRLFPSFADEPRRWDRVLADAGAGNGRKRMLRLRVALLAAALAVALAVPALAVSGRLAPLLGLSNEGTEVDTNDLDLGVASAIDSTLAEVQRGDARVRLLASRNGVSLFATRTADGSFCVFTGRAEEADEPGRLGGGCYRRTGIGFPSREHPVLDLTTLVAHADGTGRTFVGQLKGVAADGVERVEAWSESGLVVASAPVVDNVYVGPRRAWRAPSPGEPSVAAIVGVDRNGDVVYRKPLGGP